MSKAQSRNYYEAHKAEIKLKQKAYYLENKSKIAARQLARRTLNPDEWKRKINARVSQYRLKPEVRERRRVEARRRYKENPAYFRDHLLRRRHNISIEQYQDMLNIQNGVCAICGGTNNHPSRWGTRITVLSVDHCHDTGIVRGLLCHHCNSGLGHFKDNIQFLITAIKYLTDKRSLHSFDSSRS